MTKKTEDAVATEDRAIPAVDLLERCLARLENRAAALRHAMRKSIPNSAGYHAAERASAESAQVLQSLRIRLSDARSAEEQAKGAAEHILEEVRRNVERRLETFEAEVGSGEIIGEALVSLEASRSEINHLHIGLSASTEGDWKGVEAYDQQCRESGQ